ncbi:MAG: hypothetical protein ACP5E4_00200, partial [Candidatus Aenigmatarchaeota archaeon]
AYTREADVMSLIEKAAEKCWKDNSGSSKSSVCEKLTVNLTEGLSKAAIENRLKYSNVPQESLVAEDISGFSQVVVSYRQGKIYIGNR